jgi:hypothetical protein
LELIDHGGNYDDAADLIKRNYYPDMIEPHLKALDDLKQQGATVGNAGRMYG